MTYRDRFVAVVKCRGKILREHGEEVTIPFGEEYSILLKNLESRKALVSVTIDGKSVTGGQIIINPNDSVELEGFVDGLKVTNKFKFIKKTKEISDHRGDRVDDGIIRVEYTFEKRVVKQEVITDYNCRYRRTFWCHGDCWYCNRCDFHPIVPPVFYGSTSNMMIGSSLTQKGSSSGKLGSSDLLRGPTYESSVTSSVSESKGAQVNSLFCNTIDNLSKPLEDEGITVKGSESDQSFVYGSIGKLEEQSNIIILRLRGTDSKGEIVQKPIEVARKLKCETCGRVAKSSAKFCPNCGTSLI